MSYLPGTYIDLRHLNKKKDYCDSKKSLEQAGQRLYEVGTQFIFKLTPAGFQAAVKIPVAYG